jgi:peptidyl-prolyl cis-trans isomerase A (cyclophilin A)
MIIMSTSAGDIHIELYADKAPISVKNFLTYVDSGHYDGTIFHRVIPDFMIQGGGFTADMRQKQTNAPIKNEANNGLSNEPYTLAMARTSDINSATCQFFINLSDNTFLDHGKRDFGYAVFGKVVKGTEIVDKIAEAKTGRSGGHGDVPVTPITINSMKKS